LYAGHFENLAVVLRLSIAMVLAAPSVPVSKLDQRVQMHGVTFAAYETMLACRGESSVPRMTYLEGELELISPSDAHETAKKRLARLFEAWLDEMGLDVDGVGSWTIKNREAERGAEPDECYVVGGLKPNTLAPDVAIEVTYSSGGINKLDVYRKLRVREVWFYSDDKLTFYVLRGEDYVASVGSTVFPSLDVKLLTSFMKGGSQRDATLGFRTELRKRAKKKPR
jgi:Uma2 family endonuclease